MEAQVRAVLLLLVIVLSTAEDVKNLTGTVGGSITLPEPVLHLGFILYGKKNLAMVIDGKLKILENMYEKKVLWNNSTGRFTITDLQRNDSGIYSTDAKQAGVITAYKVSVYDSVSGSVVSTRTGSSDTCILLCVVDKAEETTLSWYKDDDLLRQNVSTASLSLTVHESDYNSSYRCVAANPAESKTWLVDVKTTCALKHKGNNQKEPNRQHVIGIVVPIVSALVIGIVGIVIKKRFHNHKKSTAAQGPENTEADVQYTDVHFYENRRGQEQNVPDASGNLDRTELTTVYDKLEFHRLVSGSTDTAACI